MTTLFIIDGNRPDYSKKPRGQEFTQPQKQYHPMPMPEFKGVTWCSEQGLWRADGYLHNRQTNIGRYRTFREAVEARMKWEKAFLKKK